MSERVLVCGGRDFDDYDLLDRVLSDIHAATPIKHIIEGGATGADYLAADWSQANDIPSHATHSADWRTHGRAAGPIRNQKMLTEERPDLVVAFPGGRGTADMVRRAKAAGVEVREITHDPR